MGINEPLENTSKQILKISDLDRNKLMFDDPETLQQAENLILSSTPDKDTLLRLEQKSICQKNLDDNSLGSMPRYKRLTSLDAIIRQCKVENIDPLLIEKIHYLDYRDIQQEENSDGVRATTIYSETGTPTILIFHQQQYLTDQPDVFNAIDSAHEAKHFCQITKGELKEEDIPNIHKGYQQVRTLSKREFGTKVIKPSTLRWMVDYYGKKGVAHNVEVEAVKSSIEVVKTMGYLDLGILNE